MTAPLPTHNRADWRSRASALTARLRPVKVWSFPLVLVCGLALAAITVRTPKPATVVAPSHRFSAERAMADVKVVGAAAHPTGSAAGEAVRRHIFDRLEALGMVPEVRLGQAARSWGSDRSRIAAASTQNITAVLPGRDPAAPAVLVMAHHDSVPNSPGAADDGAGVAALLETARSLAVDAPHARNVIFLVTDAEEVGLLGAQAFFDTDPLAKHVGAVLNMDTRGAAGRAAMFRIGPQSGVVLDAYRRTAASPFASSLTALVASILPNDTDFTVASGARLPGLDVAFIGDQLAYHTPLATPDRLSRGTLQSMGGQVLPVARALADAPDLDPRPAPAAWTDVFGLGLLVLPWWAGALLWLWAAGLAGFAGWRAWRAGMAPPWEVARGAGLTLTATLAAALALGAAGTLLGSEGLRIYALVGRYGLLFTGCALLALASALGVLIAAGRRRAATIFAILCFAAAVLAQAKGLAPTPLVIAVLAAGLGALCLPKGAGPWSLWLGALALGVVTSLGLQIALPAAAPIILLPTVSAAAGAVAVFSSTSSEGRGRLALLAAGGLAVAALGWLGGFASGMFVAAGPFLPGLLSVFVLLALIGCAPFVRLWTNQHRAWMGAAALGITATVALMIVGLSGATVSRPRPTTLMTVQDGAGRTLRVAPSLRLDPWTTAALGAHPAHALLDPLFTGPVWSTPTRSTALPAPSVETLRIDGRLILHVRPGGAGRRLTLWLKSPAALSDPRLNARAIPWTFAPNRWSRVDFHAPPPEGVTLSLAAPDAIELDIVAGRLSDGPPPGAEPPPPPPPGWMPFGDSGAVVVLSRAHLRT